MAPASSTSKPNERFRASDMAAEDQLKSQTVGLVQLSDFRKRRAEALDVEAISSATSGASTPTGSEEVKFATKKRKAVKKGGLSFGGDGDDESSSGSATLANKTKRAKATAARASSSGDDDQPKRLTANAGVGFVAKSMTKAAMARETETRERLRREFLAVQERVKATEFLVPFVFYDGADAPGGVCRMRKGDQIWRFLDRAKKVGAGKEGGMRHWGRVSVDDLMLVKDGLIIPHHLEFYFFMLNKTKGFDGLGMFPYSVDVTKATPLVIEDAMPAGGLSIPGQRPVAEVKPGALHPDSDLEGYGDDASFTKVVDRRWYEKHKHIFPTSVWQDFDPEKDYSQLVRKDASGNAYHSNR